MSIPQYRIERLGSTDTATFGQLVDVVEQEVCKTLELPDRDNHPDTSRVPAGSYFAHRRLAADTEHGYDVFQLEDVPGRSEVQIHVANKPSQLRGCIALGTHFGELDDEHAVLESKLAYDAWMARNAGVNRIRITITDPPAVSTL